ncbi:hypothetical protein BV22DRAFT_1135289 [Leucogyrophana mollusca]|uniref:Uncharacterized protein n=1 Tax=Leucogyrophana mollusca TaxID=85980 RepID=A0ACB8AX86_9AGAM|nr:hypothetical protein BV22DRAFT_1135289 [Leucogyrophana mollusca]
MSKAQQSGCGAASSKRNRANSTNSLHKDAAAVKQKKKPRNSDNGVQRDSRDPPPIPVTAAAEPRDASQWDLLMRLDSWQRPGLSVAEFKKLFKSCTCGLVMTERVFEGHECARILQPEEAGILVDLTVGKAKGSGPERVP